MPLCIFEGLWGPPAAQPASCQFHCTPRPYSSLGIARALAFLLFGEASAGKSGPCWSIVGRSEEHARKEPSSARRMGVRAMVKSSPLARLAATGSTRPAASSTPRRGTTRPRTP
ncbi:unnamed protein product [Prorocentrum cordatum]|uniref:Uncharacterized protein n=1 Tax=Prorocentrum cordatum TaxID=2364126 RepID=A0ABN9TUM3_9DINO|nr:unnamed protein product [Polarella glacialis]